MKDLVRNYNDVPIKVTVGEEPYGAAAGINAVPFVYGDAAKVLAHLNSEWEKLDGIMAKVFKQFDTDMSGFIDAKELKALSKELSGKAMSNAELEEIMKDFHVTKDNKISEKQFKQWWASGKQGLSPLMRNLLGAKLNTLRFFDSISENLKKAMDETAAEASQEDISNNQLQILFNKFEQSGIMLSAKLMFFSPQLEETHNTHKLKHNFVGVEDLDEKAIVSISFPVKGCEPHEAVAKITELVDAFGLPPAIRGHISIIQDQEMVCVAMPTPKKVNKQELDSFRPVLEQVQK